MYQGRQNMREIREMTLDCLDEYVELAYNTYPSFKDNTDEGKEQFKKLATLRITDPNSVYYGMFEGDKLIAAMRLLDFNMNFFGRITTASGLASLAVHLMHKKEKIAKTMVDFYENLYRERNLPIATLLPFKPDFYKKMGYGLGTKMNQYRIPAERFPGYFSDVDLRFMKSEQDKDEVLSFHKRIVASTHGMFEKMVDEIDDLYNNVDNRIIASYDDTGAIDAYLIFEFVNGKEDNYTINNMHIKELQYTTSTSLDKILGFIKKQDDQVNMVVYNTQDEYFANKIDNPLNDTLNYVDFGYMETNTQSIGVMYKILDVEQAFKMYDYRNYNNADFNAKFNVQDETGDIKSVIVCFEDGKAKVFSNEKAEKTITKVEVDIHIVDFSALFVGSATFAGLEKLGLVKINDTSYLQKLDLAFYTPYKPICNTDF